MGEAVKDPKAVFDAICLEIATSSSSLKVICSNNGISYTTLKNWLNSGTEAMIAQYARAKEDQMDFLGEEILEIADDDSADDTPFTGINHVHRDKLKIEARKWLMGKLKPKKYGEKLDVTTDGEKINNLPLSPVINVYQTGVGLASSESDIDDNKPEPNV
jgi:hypothetical protein